VQLSAAAGLALLAALGQGLTLPQPLLTRLLLCPRCQRLLLLLLHHLQPLH
jgi:hypothetical protein